MPVATVIPNGKRIREVRLERGLSCAKVAAILSEHRHRHPKTIDRIERQRIPRVSVVLINEIADALETPVEEFIKEAA